MTKNSVLEHTSSTEHFFTESHDRTSFTPCRTKSYSPRPRNWFAGINICFYMYFLALEYIVKVGHEGGGGRGLDFLPHVRQ